MRDRQGDIRLLSQAFLQRYSEENKRKVLGFTSKALHALENHHWPGNIRELENRVKRAVIMAEGGKITAEDLELAPPYAKNEGRTLKEDGRLSNEN